MKKLVYIIAALVIIALVGYFINQNNATTEPELVVVEEEVSITPENINDVANSVANEVVESEAEDVVETNPEETADEGETFVD
ncbi:MAG: hypothetical protein E7019_01435 [Alphaproteobacteria bacterium]|nr:hypothetical protein [Alphaproteobacteria bacterium]